MGKPGNQGNALQSRPSVATQDRNFASYQVSTDNLCLLTRGFFLQIKTYVRTRFILFDAARWSKPFLMACSILLMFSRSTALAQESFSSTTHGSSLPDAPQPQQA